MYSSYDYNSPGYLFCNGFHSGVAATMNPNKENPNEKCDLNFMDVNGNRTPIKYLPYADCFSEGLASMPVQGEDGNMPYGYMDVGYSFVIEPQFVAAENFHDGLALVSMGEKTGYIDKTGKIAIPLIYDECERCLFGGGVVSIRKGGKMGVIDKSGNTVIPFEYDYIDDLWNNTEVNATKGGVYMVLDRAGKVLHSLSTDGMPFTRASFAEGLWCVVKEPPLGTRGDSSYGYYSPNGEPVIPIQYQLASSFKNGFAIVEKDDEYFLIDKNGNEVLPYRYDYMDSDCDGIIMGYKGHELHFFTPDGELMLLSEFNAFEEQRWYKGNRFFCEGLLAICKGGKWGYIDKSGNEVIPFRYDSATSFNEGYAAVYESGIWSPLKNPLK